MQWLSELEETESFAAAAMADYETAGETPPGWLVAHSATISQHADVIAVVLATVRGITGARQEAAA